MYKKYIKRIIDFVISFIVLILFSPLYVLIAVLIKIKDNGPIFYKQNRTGKDGKIFKIYKFRTMKDGKVTKIGKVLRTTSLDEIPQFYNVLKGDMSIIGPRPWIPDYYDNFNEEQRERTLVKPGLVGLAQVNGRKMINIFDKINYDIKYVKNLSLCLDLKIILKSMKIIIAKENIGEVDIYIKKEIEMLKSQKDFFTNVNN